MTGACGCEKFPLRKGGSADGAGGCLARPESQGKRVGALLDTKRRGEALPNLQDNPRAATPLPPLLRGNILLR